MFTSYVVTMKLQISMLCLDSGSSALNGWCVYCILSGCLNSNTMRTSCEESCGFFQVSNVVADYFQITESQRRVPI